MISGEKLPANIEMGFYDWNDNIVTSLSKGLFFISPKVPDENLSIEGPQTISIVGGKIILPAEELSFLSSQGSSHIVETYSKVLNPEKFDKFNNGDRVMLP